MIFQHTWGKVLSGEKTQTRRIIKPHERQRRNIREDGTRFIEEVARGDGSGWVDTKDRVIYYVGQQIAVQPGRGKKGVGRIEITGIRREDVREISAEDVKAEGFKYTTDFHLAWKKMHDPRIDCVMKWYLETRPAERYQAWVLTFRLVE